MRYATPDDWDVDSVHPRDKMMHGVQIAFGRIYAGGAFGEFPNEALEVARQAAFALIDHSERHRLDDGLRECDECGLITDAGDFPDWPNGVCPDCEVE